MAALSHCYERETLSFAESFQDDRDAVLVAVRRSGAALQFASARLQDSEEIVQVAVQQSGEALEFASPRLQDLQEIVEVAVQGSGVALQFASSRLRDDDEFVLSAVHCHSDWFDIREGPFGFASWRLRSDRQFVLLAVSCYGRNLQYATALQDDIEVALAAVAHSAEAFLFASESLQCNIDFILLALEHSQGTSLGFLPEEFKRMPEVCWYAVATSPVRQGVDILFTLAQLPGLSLRALGFKRFVSEAWGGLFRLCTMTLIGLILFVLVCWGSGYLMIHCFGSFIHSGFKSCPCLGPHSRTSYSSFSWSCLRRIDCFGIYLIVSCELVIVVVSLALITVPLERVHSAWNRYQQRKLMAHSGDLIRKHVACGGMLGFRDRQRRCRVLAFRLCGWIWLLLVMLMMLVLLLGLIWLPLYLDLDGTATRSAVEHGTFLPMCKWLFLLAAFPLCCWTCCEQSAENRFLDCPHTYYGV